MFLGKLRETPLSQIIAFCLIWLPVVLGIGQPDSKRFHVDAMISFTSTTIDDFAVMLYFMSLAELQEDEERSKAYVGILIAFFIGYTIVGGLALISLLFGMVMSKKYIALAGFVPLLAGIHKVYEALDEQGYFDSCRGGASPHSRSAREREMDDTEHRRNRTELIKNYNMVEALSDSDENEYSLEVPPRWGNGTGSHQNDIRDLSKKDRNGQSVVNPVLAGASPIGGKEQNSGTHLDDSTNSPLQNEVDLEQAEFDPTGQRAPPRYISDRKFLGVFSWRSFKENMWKPLNWEVLMMTLAAGSDHVVIYNAMLEDEATTQEVFLSILVYYIMLIVHVVAAIALIRCKFIANLFQTYSIFFIILLLIGTGIYILSDSVLFCPKCE